MFYESDKDKIMLIQYVNTAIKYVNTAIKIKLIIHWFYISVVTEKIKLYIMLKL